MKSTKDEPECHYECEANEEKSLWCDDSNDGYTCTRLKNHEGPHVACGRTGHSYKVWEETP